jgi:hypothetical protein
MLAPIKEYVPLLQLEHVVPAVSENRPKLHSLHSVSKHFVGGLNCISLTSSVYSDLLHTIISLIVAPPNRVGTDSGLGVVAD